MQGIAQKILANPSKYSIQELQQGVEHGIIPAYIAVPLIQEKVQQQRQMQMAQSMQQPPAKNQPSIAEQVMAEARGVEGLPTGLPQQYAGGGIIAFEEGGPVERYQSGGYSSQGMTYETVYDRMNRQNRERAAAEEAERLQRVREAGGNTTPYGEQMGNALGMLGNIPLAGFKHLVSAPGYGLSALMDRGSAAPASAPTATDLGPVPGTSDSTSVLGGAPAAGPKPAPLGGAPTTRADSSGIGLGGLSALGRGPGVGLKAPTFTVPEGPSYESSARDFYENYGKTATARDTEQEQKIAAEQEKVKGQAYDEYKSALQKEAMDAGADREQAKYMALFKAGLAMMAGTSRHALENIGKGAMVGAEDYQAAVKDLKKADKERQKELANIEQARRAEAIGDRDTAIKRLDAARDRADARERFIGEGIYKATNLDRAQSFDLAKTKFQNESDIFRTQLAGEYQLAGHRIGAEATVAAANARANQREGISQYQLARLRADAEKQVDPNVIRAQLAQQLKLSKAPKAGADAEFEKRFQAAYAAAIDDRVNRNLGVGGGMGGGQGFQLPQGYKILGAE